MLLMLLGLNFVYHNCSRPNRLRELLLFHRVHYFQSIHHSAMLLWYLFRLLHLKNFLIIINEMNCKTNRILYYNLDLTFEAFQLIIDTARIELQTVQMTIAFFNQFSILIHRRAPIESHRFGFIASICTRLNFKNTVRFFRCFTL